MLRQFPLESIPRGGLVVLGTAGGTSGWNEGIEFDIREELSADLNIDSHATIRTTQGARGIDVAVDDENHYYGRLRVRNFGSIETTGGGAAHEGRVARGVVAASRGGVVEVVNESGASVVTRGPGGRGITAGSVGSVATAINRGTITTHGHRYNNRSSEGVAAFAQWDDTTRGGGIARAANETGGTVTTYGHGAIGVFAHAGSGRKCRNGRHRDQCGTHHDSRERGIFQWCRWRRGKLRRRIGASHQRSPRRDSHARGGSHWCGSL